MREVLRINALQDFPKNVRRIGKIVHRQMASTTLHIVLASIQFLVGTYVHTPVVIQYFMA